ncbi:MBL fold metallo-hydrolase [Chloroflexia bacterium SDU3-3]|nr:MBL fold metallo-hydrolase [Chloroflexia bacterium SDU3-3]
MANFICQTCGTQFADSELPPAACPICQDERQYVGRDGQRWTTIEQLRESHHNRFEQQEPSLTGIGSEPGFALGQRALLVQTPEGNVLWDCISLVDDATVAQIQALGGLKAIAISHPHYYASMVSWSEALGGVPIYLHADDRQWVMRPSEAVRFWEGETLQLVDGVTLIRCGGHFAGSAVLHWAAGAEGRGVLLTGDTIHIVQDRRFVSFMRSYPNLIPLPASAVRRIVAKVEPFPFDRIYGAWWHLRILTEAKQAISASAERYIRAISE